MTDERDTTPDHDQETGNTVDDTLDALLPVPEESTGEPPEHDQVDGPLDELLPTPGSGEPGEDDTSTSEELEVDTTADNVDDFIPLQDQSQHADSFEEEHSSFVESHAPAEKDSPTNAASCLVCGEQIAGSRFCPACGTEQVPASKFVAGLAPLFMWSRALPIRVALSIGVFLTLFALLADSGTSALIISASIVPIVLLVLISGEIGGQDRNDWVKSGMMILIGAAVGLPIAWLASRMVVRSWFEGGVIHFGATNFGGIAVETVGSAPILVWLTNGILLPLVVLLAIGAAPAALRMALGTAPRERTGLMLSAAVAAGYILGSTVVFYWPLFKEIAPIMSTSEWTLTILGVAVIRPLVWVFSGAMLGSVVWRYLREASLPRIAVPGAIAIGLPLGYSILGLAIAPTGLWASTILGIAFAAATVYFHTKFLEVAAENDSSLQ